MDKKRMLEHLDEKIKQLRKLPMIRQVAEELSLQLDKQKVDYDFVMQENGTYLVIEVHTVDDLHTLRQELKKMFGRWEDSITNVWEGVRGRGIASYDNPKNSFCRIWLEMPVEDFPEIKKGCRFKAVKKEGTQYVYACDAN